MFEAAWDLAILDTTEPHRETLLRDLATEMSYFLQGSEMFETLKDFLAALPADVPILQSLDSTLVGRMYVALRVDADPQAAADLIAARDVTGCFPTLGKARSVIIDLWEEAQVALAEAAKGAKLTPLEGRDARVGNPVPRNIGAPYAAWSYPDVDYW